MRNLEGKEISRRTIVNTMRQELDNCVDPKTNEVNCTQLAETAAQTHNLYGNAVTYPIHEEVFDIAIEVAEKYG